MFLPQQVRSFALAGLAFPILASPASAQWTRVDTNGLPPSASGLVVQSVATSGTAVFVTNGSPNLLWRSTDDGASWARVEAVPSPASGLATVLAAEQTVLVQDGAPTPALHVSVDGGATWTRRPAPAPLDVSILTLARAETSAGRSHAFVSGQNPNRLYVTHDDFATVEAALPDLAVDQVVSNGSVLLALPTRTTPTMTYYRSVDGGRTWAPSYTGALAADTAFPTRDSLFVFRLTPSGTHFTRSTIFGGADGTEFPSLAVVTSGPSTVVESSHEHPVVYHTFQLSTDGGRDTRSIRVGFPEQRFGPVAFACHGDGGPGFNRAVSTSSVFLIASCDETGATVLGALYRHAVTGGTVAVDDAPLDATTDLRAPNPVRGAAAVTVRLEAPTAAAVAVYDVRGRRVATLADGRLGAGDTVLAWRTDGLAPGVYWLCLDADGRRVTRPVTVLR